MKRLIFGFCFSVLSISAFSQITPISFFVFFKDKNGSPYSTSRPTEFLTQRAIDRRTKSGVAITQQDIPVVNAYLDSLKSVGAVVRNTSRWFNGATITVPDSNVLFAVNSLSCVKGIEAVAKLRLQPLDTAEKAAPRKLSSFQDSIYGHGYTQIVQTHTNCLHNMGYRGEGVYIAVFDAGFPNLDANPAFEPLFREKRVVHMQDMVDGDNYPLKSSSHGSYVMSCLAANIPGIMVGTAPDASYLLFRTEDVFSERLIEEFNWVAAAEIADSLGADVFSTSLGYTDLDPVTGMPQHDRMKMDGNTAYITRGADFAASKGILVVNSAGNEGGNGWGYISAPSDGDSVLCVGATDSDGVYASFSGKGPYYNKRVKPNVAVIGAKIPLLDPSGNPTYSNGTSFSCPVTAGIAACLVQCAPSKTNMQVIAAMQSSASQAKNPDSLLGNGIPNACAAYKILNNIPSTMGENASDFLFYPNPFSSSVRLLVNVIEGGNGTLKLYGSDGKLVKYVSFTASNNKQLSVELNGLDALPNGVYLCRFELGRLKFTKQLVK